MDTAAFSPREFLKARRPEQFSDTEVEDMRVLDRSTLEYNLETLTSRGEEKLFEDFARRLAEREIAPNLLPQTGPTGGGDSKVDSETYPVAERLTYAWFVGAADEAAKERWAFAFSAKKQWQSKVRSDIAKIAATKRGYTKAYFVTNQFVRDRARGELEDELRKKHGLDVRILDRTWILDRVFRNRHEDLAIDALGLHVPLRADVRRGPRDAEREQELEQVEGAIATMLQTGPVGPTLVDLALDAATLARGLERPRAEVEGLLLRADRLARNAGTDNQQVRAAYLGAWTAYFWFEDSDLFLECYEKASARGTDSRNAADLEMLTTLWMLSHGAVATARLSSEQAQIKKRARMLSVSLKRLMKEEGRPSTTLQAETLRLQMRLVLTLWNGGNPDRLLRELASVVRRSVGLVGFPIEPLVSFLTDELGSAFDGTAAYEELFGVIESVTAEREGGLRAARLLLKRGAQQLDAGRSYETIRTVGRALVRLYTHESRSELVRALSICGAAYEDTDLLWAARGTILNAASVATNEFWSYSDITPAQVACYRKLKWLELRLGRIPHVLAWHELDRVMTAHLEGEARAAPSDMDVRLGIILGILLLKADVWQLKALQRLPDVLEHLGLHFASVALLYALGHEDQLPAELHKMVSDGESPHDFFRTWLKQPAAEQVAAAPWLGEGRTVSLSSQVLGCAVTVESQNTHGCVSLSESFLAALESLLSTLFRERVIAREPVLTVNIREAQFAEPPFEFELQERSGRPHVEVRCPPFNPHHLPVDVQASFRGKLLNLILEIFPRVFIAADFEKAITHLFRDEAGPDRALNFTTSLVALGNVLGHEPRTDLSAWTSMEGAREFPLRRTAEWNAEDRGAHAPGGDVQSGRGTPDHPPSRTSVEEVGHGGIRTVSLIRDSLWDAAEWTAVIYVSDPEGAKPPLLGLGFRDADPAEEIFRIWRDELGERDEGERLRIAIIRGIRRAEPLEYRVTITTQPRAGDAGATPLIVTHVRRKTLNPTSDAHLKAFLEQYAVTGEYVLVPSLFTPSAFPTPLRGHLRKRELHVRYAWEIGTDDFDASAIAPDDDPFIPPGQENVPIHDLLARLRET